MRPTRQRPTRSGWTPRWQGTADRPEIQAFYGALAGQRSKKGVFITTSGYTAQALQFAQSVESVRLAELEGLDT